MNAAYMRLYACLLAVFLVKLSMRLNAFGQNVVRLRIVCCGLFLCLGAVSGCSRSPAGEIERVLNRCAEISKKASSLGVDPAAKAAFVADSFQAVDASNCPADFRVAFQEHVNAWREAEQGIANNTLGANFFEGFLGGVTGDYSAVGTAETNASAAIQNINATYYNLTTIAAQHGARIPRSVVK